MKRFILQVKCDIDDWIDNCIQNMSPLRKRLIVLYGNICLFWFVAYLACFNWIEPTQIGLAKNVFTKRVWVIEGGMHFGAPWVLVSRVDTKPIRVSVPSAGKGTNSKLVQFDPKYWNEFINTEGWHYYWWANRLSFNFGYKDEHRGFKDIMRGYAYNAKRYPFINMLGEFSTYETNSLYAITQYTLKNEWTAQ